MKKILFIILLINHTFLPAEVAFAIQKDCSSNDNLACHLEIISRIEIQIQGDLLKRFKMDYLNLIKQRAKKDLSMLSLEENSPNFLDYTDCENVEMKKRGALFCSIMTSGRHATAFHVTIELYGFGIYKQKQDNLCIKPPAPRSKKYYPLNKNYFKGEILGVTKYDQVREKTETSIIRIMKQLSVQLLEARDRN